MTSVEMPKRTVRASTSRDGYSLQALVPVLFLVPVAIGIAVSVARLVQVRYPAYGWTMNVDSDAQAMALGVWPFQDPVNGYTGNGYTPLFPMVVSVFDHGYRWSGWSVLVTIASGVGCAALVARFAWRCPRQPGRLPRLLALAEAAGIGALGWSLVYGLEQNGLFNGRNDQPAWLPALAAIALVPAAVRGTRAATVGVVVLVTASFWVKQPGAAAALAVAVALSVAVLLGRMGRRRLFAMAFATLALNVVLFGVAGLLTDGWQLSWNFGIHLPATRTVGYGVKVLAPEVAPALLFAVALAVVVLRRRRWPSPRRAVVSDDDLLVVTALLALAALGALEGLYLLRFPGGDDNDALPLVWALAGLGAVAYRRAGDRAEDRTAAAVVCGLLALTTLLSNGDWRLRRGQVVPTARYPALPSDVTKYAEHHLVYHPALPLSFLRGREGVYPTALHAREVLNRGLTPTYLVHALVERRFSGVFGLFAPDAVDFASSTKTLGEQDFFWKLNEVIVANYRLVRRPLRIPAGQDQFLSPESLPMRVPRRTPPARYLERCFGPFALGGAQFRIHLGGGFWCSQPNSSITLVRTLRRASQLESVDPVTAVGGSLAVGTERRTGWWSIRYGDDWQLHADIRPKTGARLTLTAANTQPRVVTLSPDDLHRSRGVVNIAFAGADQPTLAPAAGGGAASVSVRVPTDSGAKLEIWSSADLGTKLNFSAIHVEGS